MGLVNRHLHGKRYVLILLLTLFISSCTKDDDCLVVPRNRTLIVYMGGDNNLSGETFQKINAIQAFVASDVRFSAGSDSQFEILIYQDPASSSGEPPKLWRAKYGQAKAELVKTYDNSNSASAYVFKRVLEDCRRYAPSDKCGLILFSHASGWLPEGTLNNPNKYDTRSVIVDGTSEMEIKDFAAAIPDKMFDFIVFEACFMAGVEVSYELKDKTNYIIASSAEMLSPGFTDIYSSLLARLTSDSDTESLLVGAADVYFNHFDNKIGTDRSATISVIKTAELDELARQVKLLQPYKVTVDVSIIQHLDRNDNRYHLFFDLEDYVMKTNSVSLTQSIENVVIYRRSTPEFLSVYSGFRVDKHCGLTTYIPQERFSSLNQKYKELRWYKEINE